MSSSVDLTRPPRILVVDDEPPIREILKFQLENAGFYVKCAQDGEEGLQMVSEDPPDLVLLDLMIPQMDGYEVCRRIKSNYDTRHIPVIILTARGEEQDRVRGLKLGADDYVVKPFGVKELLARVEAVLRRSPERPDPVNRVSVQGATVELARREIRYADGGREELSEREAELLGYFAQNAGRAIAREEILTRVWRLDPAHVETRTIDMHVARLREKLRDDPQAPKVLLTVRGKGYLFQKEEA